MPLDTRLPQADCCLAAADSNTLMRNELPAGLLATSDAGLTVS